MLADIKTRVKKTKEFVDNNRTLVACAVTAVVASKITHSITTDRCEAKFLPMLNEVATHNETAKNALHYTFHFMNDKGLMDEYVQSLES